MLYGFRTREGVVLPQSVRTTEDQVVLWAWRALDIDPETMREERRIVAVAIAVIGESEVPACYLDRETK